MIISVCLFFSLASGPAYGNTSSAGHVNTFRQSPNPTYSRDIQCVKLGSDKAFCSIRTELRYHNYLNTPLTSHERFSSTPNESNQPRADLLSVFKLALEEFDLLSGVRIYWDYTERNIKQWAVKLKLKGEISITDPHDHNDAPSLRNKSLHSSNLLQKPLRPSGLHLLLKPQKLRWNLGMNPDDLTLFGDIHINPYLSINGEFGDESNVGLYFRYTF
jgi:hypothetical protein